MNQVFQSVGSQANVILSLAIVGAFFVSIFALAIISSSIASARAKIKVK